MATLTLAVRLTEAEDAYHALQTGTAVVEVHDQNGEVVKYNLANATRLEAYIEKLKQQILDAASPCAPYNGPMRTIY